MDDKGREGRTLFSQMYSSQVSSLIPHLDRQELQSREFNVSPERVTGTLRVKRAER